MAGELNNLFAKWGFRALKIGKKGKKCQNFKIYHMNLKIGTYAIFLVANTNLNLNLLKYIEFFLELRILVIY